MCLGGVDGTRSGSTKTAQRANVHRDSYRDHRLCGADDRRLEY